MIVVSACLAGVPCRFNRGAKPDVEVQRLVGEGKAVAVCPERMAGLPSPRPPAELQGGDGHDVLCGRATVTNNIGEDETQAFIAGAEKFLKFVLAQGATQVMLKAKSPSCGVTMIYDGSFSGKLVEGCGVTAALLMENGIEVIEVP